MKTIVLAIIVSLLLCSSGIAEMREWKDSDGKKFVAELIEKENDTAVMKKEDGNEVKISFDRFSDEDKAYLESLRPFTGFLCAHINSGQGVDEMKQMLKSRSKGKIRLEDTFIVLQVFPESPAEKAGLHENDVFTRVDGKTFRSSEDYKEWSSKTSNRKRVYFTWKQSDSYSKPSAAGIFIDWKTQEEVDKLVASYKEQIEKSVRASKQKEKEVKKIETNAKEIDGKIAGLKEERNKAGKLALGYGSFVGNVVPAPNKKVRGLELVAAGNGLYGISYRYKLIDYQLTYAILLHLHNTTQKAIKSATFKVVYANPSRTVPYGEITLLGKFTGGIEPGEIKASTALSIGRQFVDLPSEREELNNNVECRVTVVGFTFYDDEEVGKDDLHPSKNQKR